MRESRIRLNSERGEALRDGKERGYAKFETESGGEIKAGGQRQVRVRRGQGTLE